MAPKLEDDRFPKVLGSLDNGMHGVRNAAETSGRKRNKPHWARLPRGDIWQIDVKFLGSRMHSEEYTEDNGQHIDGDEEEDDEVCTYLVHRYTIGPQSEYFNFLFSDDNRFSESQEKRSRIEFPAESGITRHDFEDLLDFLYDEDEDKTMELDSEKALTMLYLADYFGIESVRRQAQEYLPSQLNSSACSGEWLAELYKIAESIHSQELQNTIAIKCHDAPFLFQTFWSCLQSPELQREFLHRICRERRRKSDRTTPWSAQIVSVISRCPDIVDRALFAELTEKEIMPEIETVFTALVLLKHEHRLGLDQRQSDELTCLQHRCTSRLHEWSTDKRKVMKYPTAKEVLKELRALKPAVMESLLLRTMDF